MARQKRKDSDSESKLIRELRKKNQRLVTENRQLRKENRRLREGTAEDPFQDEPEALVFVPVEPQERPFSCPRCGTYTKNIFELRQKTYYRCEGCGSKGPVTNQK